MMRILPQRRQLRLKDYDYSSKGMYFVTICTFGRICLFGKIENGNMELNDFGIIVWNEWKKTSEIWDNVELDEFIVMPNHFHGIVHIADGRRGTARRAPTLGHRKPTMEQFGKPISGSVPTIIRAFKSAVTKHINQFRNTPTAYIWQRNYYEHIIRNDAELNKIQEYIQNNPMNWDNDTENINGNNA